MSEPAQKCGNNEAIVKQNYTLKLLFLSKWPRYSCCFSLGGNLDFPELLQKLQEWAVLKNYFIG